MRRIPFAVVLLIVAVSLGAQEARVILLKTTDANHARCTYERLQAAQKEWEAVQEDVSKAYTVVDTGDPEAGNYIIAGETNFGCISANGINGVLAYMPCSGTQQEKAEKKGKAYRRGWESGFQFSSDFKYIVPKGNVTVTGTSSLCNGMLWYGNCTAVTH